MITIAEQNAHKVWLTGTSPKTKEKKRNNTHIIGTETKRSAQKLRTYRLNVWRERETGEVRHRILITEDYT